VIIPEASVPLPSRLAGIVAAVLEEHLRAARADGIPPTPGLIEFASDCRRLADAVAARRRQVSAPQPMLDAGGCEGGESWLVTIRASMSVADAAGHLGISPQGVTKALDAGRLVGHKVSGVWLIDPATVETLREARS
jgi:hypothetical protein